MVTYRGTADEESLGDLRVLNTFAYEADDFSLPLGKGRDLGPLGVRLLELMGARDAGNDAPGHRAFQPHLTGVNLFDRFDQDLSRSLLWNHPHGSEANGASMHLGVPDSGQDQHSRVSGDTVKVPDEVQPVFAPEVQIEQDNIRLLAGSESHGLAAIAGLANYDKSRAALYEEPQPGADDLMVLNEQDSNESEVVGRHAVLLSVARGRKASDDL